MDNKEKLKEYINKRNRKTEYPVIGIKPVKMPWYKRELLPIEFTHKKAKNGKFYIRHDEWSPNIWIGPYETESDVNEIVQSYVSASLTTGLSKNLDSRVHSLIIDDITFF